MIATTSLTLLPAFLRAARALSVFALAPFACFLFGQSVLAGSATWNLNPPSGDWNTAANWAPMTIPNSSTDTATFDVSNLTGISFQTNTISVNRIVFNPGASAFTITAGTLNNGAWLSIYDGGVVNNSGTTQNFVAAGIFGGNDSLLNFFGAATAGTDIVYTNKNYGQMYFYGVSSADHATFVNDSAGTGTKSITFRENSSAANGIFSNGASGTIGSFINFWDNSTAGNGFFTNKGEGAISCRIVFINDSTAGAATIVSEGGEDGQGAVVSFNSTATADHGNLVFKGGIPRRPFSGAHGDFFLNATAGEALLTVEGSSASGAPGASVTFNDTSTAGNSTLIATNGPATNTGGVISFIGDSLGDRARVELSGPVGSGTLTIESHNSPGITTGSIEGAGLINLGANNLTVGSNNLSTTFSGVISDGQSGNVGGSLTKVGAGTLTLSGANTYTGGTSVSQGTLVVSNGSGSASGTGAITASAGTLGGSGTVTGPVIIGSGSGMGAVLAPAAGSKMAATFTTSSPLLLNADASYLYTGRAKGRQAKTDLVVANGVTISGATLSSRLKVTGSLQAGTVFTVISNTSSNPINGAFNNLPDGAIVVVGAASFQASYEGGDGNDLTLTVVP